MTDDVGLGERCTWLRHYECADIFTANCMRDAHNGRGLYRVELADRVFHFLRIDVKSVGYDHVLEPIEDVDIAVRIQFSDVAGMQPPAAQCLGGEFGLAPVTDHCRFAAE